MIFLRIVFPLVLLIPFSNLFMRKECANPAGTEKIFPDSIRSFSTTFYPKKKKRDQIIDHAAFRLCYDENYEQPRWVAYRLTADMCSNAHEERTDDFRVDPSVKTGSATPDDYKKTGYDRGHLCPAGDMGWSEITMRESFFMSNMSPQEPKFNRGIWKSLESNVREWVKRDKELYVVTAGVLKDTVKVIGTNKVGVPKLFYKIVLDVRGPEYKAIGFVMPNEGSKLSVFDYAVTIDSVERLTGINFFPALPDKIEKNLESHINVSLWK